MMNQQLSSTRMVSDEPAADEEVESHTPSPSASRFTTGSLLAHCVLVRWEDKLPVSKHVAMILEEIPKKDVTSG